MAGEEEKVGDKPLSVLRHLLQRLWGIFRTERRELSSGIQKACFPRALVQTGRMCKLPCPSCSYSGNLAKNLLERQSQAAEPRWAAISPAPAAGAGGGTVRVPGSHRRPRLIWIYRSATQPEERIWDLRKGSHFWNRLTNALSLYSR